MCLAVRLGIIWEPIPNPAFPGFEPVTATMPSEHVGTELTASVGDDLTPARPQLRSDPGYVWCSALYAGGRQCVPLSVSDRSALSAVTERPAD